MAFRNSNWCFLASGRHWPIDGAARISLLQQRRGTHFFAATLLLGVTLSVFYENSLNAYLIFYLWIYEKLKLFSQSMDIFLSFIKICVFLASCVPDYPVCIKFHHISIILFQCSGQCQCTVGRIPKKIFTEF